MRGNILTDNKRRYTLLAIMVLCIILPFFSTSFVMSVVTYSLIFGIFAMAYDLSFGYTGIVSLGHSVFFGISAYSVGMLTKTVFHVHNPILLFLTAIIVGASLGFLIGYFCTYVKGIYIVIVTFAFAQIFSLLVMADPGGITAGENGIVGVRPGSISLGGLEVNLFKGIGLYYLSLMVFIGSYFIIKVIVNSQIGDVFKGIKHNEERMLSLGYNTRPYQILAFVFSASISAVAGVLIAFMDNTISPGIVDWSVGAEALLFCVLGSPGTLIGPVIAALVITFLKYYVSSWFGGGNWVYILGGLYIAVIMFMPGGLLNTRIFRFLNQNCNES